jgi:preprotein translocase subunit SecG
MYGFLLVLHLVICMILIAVVLVQSGKGGGLAGGAFGGSAQTVFGGRGATDFFTRATMILGVSFFITSLTLALMSSGRGGASGPGRSLIQQEAQRGASQAPATGAPPAAGTVPAPSPSAPAAPSSPPANPPSTGGGTTP